MMMSGDEDRRWMMTRSGREMNLRWSIEQKRARWFERWRLCGRAQESSDDGEVWESELVGLTSLMRSPGVSLISRA